MSTSSLERSKALAEARRYVHQLAREGQLDEAEAARQLRALTHAARSGRSVLVVADIRPPASHADRRS
jgi:hypothetical protein